MMQDYADSHEPLTIRQISESEFEVVDDFDYNVIKGGVFATGYTQFHQPTFVQLPTGLVDPRKIPKMKFTFASTKTAEDEDSQQDPPDQTSEIPEPKMKSNPDTSASSSSSSSQSSSSDEEPVMVDMPAT